MSSGFYTLAVWGNNLLVVYPKIEECIALPKDSFMIFGKERECYVIDIPEDLEEFVGNVMEHESWIQCIKEVVSRETTSFIH